MQNTALKQEGSKDNHIAKQESQFSPIASIGSVVDDTITLAVLTPSLTICNEYAPLVSLVITIQEDEATWNIVTTVLLEEEK